MIVPESSLLVVLRVVVGLGRGSKLFFCGGLGQSVGGFGWAGSKKMDLRTTLRLQTSCLHYFTSAPAYGRGCGAMG